MAADLHAHSSASDGTLSPSDLVARAAAAGVRTLALTDHDTVEGVPEALAAAARHGIELVPGIELSVRVPRGTFHLLGWFAEAAPPVLADRLPTIAAARERRNREILDRLADLGAPVAWDDVARRARGRIGRPHIADALVAAGHARDRGDAFDRFLGSEAPAYVAVGALEPGDAVRLVKSAGGAASIAHPGSLRLEDAALDALLHELAGVGLDGIEVHRGDHDDGERERYGTLAARHGLLATAGSDYHGPEREADGRILGATGADDDGALEAVLARRRARSR